MKDLAQRFIDKECLIYSFDGSHQYEGVIKEVIVFSTRSNCHLSFCGMQKQLNVCGIGKLASTGRIEGYLFICNRHDRKFCP